MALIRSNKSGGGVVVQFLANVAGGANVNLDVSNILPNYAELTADNFFYNLTGITIRDASSAPTLAKNYNASTGVLTINTSVGSGVNYCETSGKLYYISDALPTS